MGFLHGKRALITGVLSQRSIAWGIANAMHREGAQLAFTYVSENLKNRVDEAAATFASNIVLPCDVTRDGDISALFEQLGTHWDGFDILVHSIGFAPREALQGEFLDGLTRENFAIAHDISSYSLAALAKAARPLMKGRGGSILTLTYLGAERSLANYNVMGLAKASLEANVRYLAYNLGPEGTRVNAISAGPDQDAGRVRHRELPQDARTRRAKRAAAAQRVDRGSRQRRRLPVFRPGLRCHRRNHLCRRGLQHTGHDRGVR